ncbi:hypothetical protein [Apibacter sp. HY039]|uniref:hypothetical protein n=1 Tax=Apibacter sp. HY039 TaxID=2501476 RepID=UPI000FEB9161|nr:hypothetical protein [Apibacter sp. HY039]
MKLIENIGDVFNRNSAKLSDKILINYINRLSEIGFFAIDLGLFDLNNTMLLKKTDGFINSIDKAKTKIYIRVSDEKNFFKALDIDNIDFIEISSNLIYLVENLNSLQKEKIVVRINIDFSNGELIILNQIDTEIDVLYNNKIYAVKFSNENSLLDLDIVKNVFDFCDKNFPGLSSGGHFYLNNDMVIKELFMLLNSLKCKFLEVSTDGRVSNNFGFLPPTEKILTFLADKNTNFKFNMLSFESSYNEAKKIFSRS